MTTLLKDGRVGFRLRKHLRLRFSQEPTPTKLLNELVENYYKLTGKL